MIPRSQHAWATRSHGGRISAAYANPASEEDAHALAVLTDFKNFEARQNARTEEIELSTRVLEPETRLYRPELAQEVVAQLLRTTPQIIALTGQPGVGRTTFLAEVVAMMKSTGAAIQLRIGDLTGADSPSIIATMAEELYSAGIVDTSVLVFDNIDLESDLPTQAIQMGVISLLTEWATSYGLRSVLIYDERTFAELAGVEPVRIAKLHRIQLEPLAEEMLTDIVTRESVALAQQAGIAQLSPAIVEHALTPPTPTEAYVHPRLALERIDAAIARARVEGHHAPVQVATQHLALAGRPVPKSASELSDRLIEVVRGQDAAIHTVANRLAPALAGLSLRPERPYGVFLFSGPSGVGKTELAKQLADAVYGDSRALIRLDMSEYSSHQDSVMKLIGAHKTWKNSTKDGLLTTKIIHRPRTVLLLDEFEKSNPMIWPLFLQIFDEGRLTDGWGQIASFAETVIIMTSNLGAQEGAKRSTGFGATDAFDTSRQLREIERTLPPELLGRITETICFEPLNEQAMAQLAHDELSHLTNRLALTGWQLDFSDEVAPWIAAHRLNPAFGARHLQSNIEQELLPAFANAASRNLRITVRNGAAHVAPASL